MSTFFFSIFAFMVISNDFVRFEGSELHYQVCSGGEEVMLLFHGFGQDRHAFDNWNFHFSPKYTLYSFDLFFHGNSTWNKEDQPLSKEFLARMMGHFLSERKIDRFSVIGFSMGAKFALTLFESFPQKISSIILLAPDGLWQNRWYQLATQTGLMRRFLKSLVSHPKRFHTMATVALRLRLIDQRLLRFAESQMNTEEKRLRVYLSWVVFRNLNFKLPEISRLARQNRTSIKIVLAKKDNLIVSEMKSVEGKDGFVEFIIADAAHHSLIKKINPEILG